MVYKIQGNFNDDNFSSITTSIGTYFKILYCGANNSMYVSLLDIGNEKNAKILLKHFLQPNEEFVILPIDEYSLKRESREVQEWCRDELVRLDTLRYERDNQEKIQQMMKAMDLMEDYLKEDIQKKKVEQSKNQKKSKEEDFQF